MLSTLRSTFLIARMQLGRVALARRTLLCALLALLPAGIVLLLGLRPRALEEVELFVNPGLFLYLQVLVPVLALVMGASVVSEEVEDRTITYLFTRPIARSALLFGRYAATMLVLGPILALSVVALALAARSVGIEGKEGPLGTGLVLPLLSMGFAAGAVYTALFAAAGTFLRHPMIVGLAYAFTIEGFLANLPGKSQALTVQYYARSFLVGSGEPVWRTLEPLERGTFDPPAEALRTLLVLLVLALAAGALILRRRQFLLGS